MNRQTRLLINMQRLVVLVFFLIFFFIHGSSQYAFRSCSNTTLSPNSTYFSNLKSLSSKLSSKSSHKLYNKASVGRPPNSPAYGDFQCRGDLNATACRRCVAAATTNSWQQYCPLSVQAAVWFDECSYRYSNESFFSTLDKLPPKVVLNPEHIDGDVEGFNQIVGSTLNDTVANASSAKGSLKFATKEGSFKDATLYTLAQCTADLSTSNCGKCLKNALHHFPDCCGGRKGARVLFSRCTIRYELYAFYGGVSRSSVSSPPAESPTAFSPAESPAEFSFPQAESPANLSPPPADYPADLSPPAGETHSAPAPSTTAPPLLSGKGRATVAMVFGILAPYFLS